MPLSTVEKKIRPIRIVSTRGSLVVYVDLGLLQSGSYTRSFLEQDCVRLLKFWTAQKKKQKRHLNVYYPVIPASPNLNVQLYRRTRAVAFSWGWTVGGFTCTERQYPNDDIWQCRGTSKAVKRL